MTPKISRLIWLALTLTILPAISLADSLPNQILWNKDGAEMSFIPAGSFQMGDAMNETESWMAKSRPLHTVTLDGFYMDKTEVTVGQFKAFLADSGYNWTGSWNDVATYSPTDDHPMIEVTWYDAVAYAEWAGKRLPTEAEWEKAARGGLAGKRYPWGDETDNTKAHYDSWNGGSGTTKPVGSYAANGYGLFDMAGNAWEWCADWYDEDYYTSSPATNPPGPGTGSYRVLRGGGWNGAANTLRVAGRNHFDPAGRYGSIGFRCVSGLNFTTDSFTTLLPSDDQTGSNWFADLSLDPTDYTWSTVDFSSPTLIVRLFVQPLGGIDASAWDFSAISTVGALADQLGSSGLNLVEGTDYQLLVVGQDDQGTTDDTSDDVVETLEILLSQVTAVNAPPVAMNLSLTTAEDTAVAITLAGTDADGDTLIYMLVSAPDNGTLSGTLPNLTYTPNANYNGSDSFTYKADDGEADSNTATVSISIEQEAVNDAPAITTTAPTTATVGGEYSYTVGVADPDDANNGTDLTFSLTAEPAGMVISSTGVITWTPIEGVTTSGAVTLTVADGGEDSAAPATEVFTIAVTAVNDALISYLETADLSAQLTTISATSFNSDDINDALFNASGPTDFDGFVSALFNLSPGIPPSDLQLSQVRVAISATSDLDNPYHLPFTVHSDLLATALGDPFDAATVDAALSNSSSKSLFVTALSNTKTVTETNLDTAMVAATRVDFNLAAQLLNTDYIDQVLLKVALDSQTDGLGNTNFNQAAEDLGLSQSLLLEKIAISQAKSVMTISLVIGLNIISLPNRPDTSLTAYSLAQQISDIDTDVSVNFVIRMDPASQEFKAFVPSIDASGSAYNFSIEGGHGYIINMADADPVAPRQVSFSGGIWVDLPGAPTTISASTWAFVIDSPDPVQLGARQATSFRLSDQQSGQMRWQGSISTTDENGGGNRFRIALVDQSRSSVVEENDQLDLQIYDQQGDLLACCAFEVGSDQISRAMVEVELRLNPIPSETQLLPNYPNPFNPETWIPFELSQDAEVIISIYEASGQQVRTLPIGFKPAGIYSSRERAIHWGGRNTNGESVSSGVYFYRLQAGDYSQTRKMVILK